MKTKTDVAALLCITLLLIHFLDIYLFFPVSPQAAQSLGGIATSIELLLSLIFVITLATAIALRWILGKAKGNFAQTTSKALGILSNGVVLITISALVLGYSGSSSTFIIPKRFHSLLNFLSF